MKETNTDEDEEETEKRNKKDTSSKKFSATDKIYLDTYVFMDMLSGKEELANKAKQYLKGYSVVSSVVFAEISFHVARRDADSVSEILYLIESLPNLRVIPVTQEIATLAGSLRGKYRKKIEKKLTYFDCIHIATAISEKCAKFITGDRGMRDISEIEVEVY